MTKTELLEIMSRHGACAEATKYVRNHASEDAAAIGAECRDRSWLAWLLGCERRLALYVRVAALRAKSGQPYWFARARARATAERYAASASASAASAAAASAAAAAAAASVYAADAASVYAAEHSIQLKDLHRAWARWCAGLPEEK